MRLVSLGRWFAAIAVIGCVDAPATQGTLGSSDGADGADGIDGSGECAQFATAAAPRAGFTPGPDPDSVALYDESTIVPIAIDFKPAEWTAFKAVWKDPKWATAPNADDLWEAAKGDAWVHCRVSALGQVFEDAACRPRGSPQGWSDEVKPQLKVRFNKWNKDGRFRGVRALTLEYFRGFAAPVRDRLAMRVFRDLGLPASRVNHVRVTIDGEDRGLYQNIEPVDRELLESFFADPSGNLYEGGYIKDSNEDIPDDCDMVFVNDLFRTPPESSPDAVASLESIVDIDQLTRVLAAEVVFPTPDNLSNDSTNFYYYHQPGGRFVAIPNDLDSVLTDESGGIDADIYTYKGSQTGPSTLMRTISAVPAWRTQFEAHLVEVRDGPFAATKEHAAEVCAQIRDALATDAAWGKDYDLGDFDADCASIASYVDARTAALKAQLKK